MKLNISKEQLLNGFQAVQNVVSTRSSLPILSNALLRAAAGNLELTVTDIDVTITCVVEATVSEPGAITLPVKRLSGLVRELAFPEVEMELGERNMVVLRSGASLYKLHGISADEFPPVQDLKDATVIVLPQATFKSMLRKTCFATSTDESRYVLNGIYLNVREDKVTMVATDGRRLALVEEEIANTATRSFIIPTKAINELQRLLRDSGDVTIKVTDNQASFEMKEEGGSYVRLITKLVEGNYPNYEQVIPKETLERISFSREELLGALRRAEIMTSDKSNSVKLTFSENNLSITANTQDIGEAQESIAMNYKGKKLSIAFNPAFMMDPLKALDNDEIFFELIDELSPGVIKINGPFLYVIMPMRTN